MSTITDYDALASHPASAAAVAEPTVPITLTTSLDQYAIPAGPYMVPVSWRRTHLSTLVNKLVSTTSAEAAAVPFDFIIDASLLRTTLGEFLEASGLTGESTLNIEYVRSTLPPTRLAAFEHDDWVASVDCSFSSSSSASASAGVVYMTSSYDGSVRLFSAANAAEAVHTFSTINKATVYGGKNTALTSAAWTPNSDAIVTGGMDGRVQLWNVHVGEEVNTWKSSRKWSGEAHNAPVSAVDTAQGPSGVSVLTGGWDGVVAVWDDLASSSSAASDLSSSSSDSEEDDNVDNDTAAKRRKTTNGRTTSNRTAASKAGTLEPTLVLYHAAPSAHAVTGAKNVFTPASRISSVLFERTLSCTKNANSAWTAGYNGVLKGWDLSAGGSVHTSLSLPSSTAESRPMLSLAQLSPHSLAAGAVDRAIHIFDTRSAASAALGIAITNAHRGPVNALAAHPIDQHLFASASGIQAAVKVWDVRSSKKALFSLAPDTEADGDKGVLALDWTNDGQQLVAGGKDKRITVFRGHNIGANTDA